MLCFRMAWVRAVWQERKRQEEGTVPDSWVDTGLHVTVLAKYCKCNKTFEGTPQTI